MTKLQDILKHSGEYYLVDHADSVEYKIKALVLDMIGEVKPYVADDGREFLPLGEVTKKVSEL